MRACGNVCGVKKTFVSLPKDDANAKSAGKSPNGRTPEAVRAVLISNNTAGHRDENGPNLCKTNFFGFFVHLVWHLEQANRESYSDADDNVKNKINSIPMPQVTHVVPNCVLNTQVQSRERRVSESEK
jgi:hypothetical protein